MNELYETFKPGLGVMRDPDTKDIKGHVHAYITGRRPGKHNVLHLERQPGPGERPEICGCTGSWMNSSQPLAHRLPLEKVLSSMHLSSLTWECRWLYLSPLRRRKCRIAGSVSHIQGTVQ